MAYGALNHYLQQVGYIKPTVDYKMQVLCAESSSISCSAHVYCDPMPDSYACNILIELSEKVSVHFN